MARVVLHLSDLCCGSLDALKIYGGALEMQFEAFWLIWHQKKKATEVKNSSGEEFMIGISHGALKMRGCAKS